jgi:enhancing lycopene biosynthesis protein 2
MNIGVLVSGCGVYDGAEIQETVLTLLAIEEIGAKATCISIDKNQHHVVNHITGEEMAESRNVMIEAARISRGVIREISSIQPAEIDALVIPGGFGSAKNFSNWAFEGPNGTIHPKVKLLLVNLINIGKPIAALCVSPILLAKALEDTGIKTKLTLGSDTEKSPYDINTFKNGIESLGAKGEMKTVREILIDNENKIITAPCYMMEANIKEIHENIQDAIEALKSLVLSN